MQKATTVKALKALSQCMPEALSASLVAFAEFLDRRKGKTLGSVLTTLEKGRSNTTTTLRSPPELRSALKCFAEIVAAAGPKSSQAEAQRLVGLVTVNLDCSVAEFIADLEASDAKPVPKKRSTVSTAPNEQLATELLGRLKVTLRRPGEFAQVLADLSDPKKVDTPTLHRVTKLLIGRTATLKGRKTALDAIRRRHHDELRYAFQEDTLEALKK